MLGSTPPRVSAFRVCARCTASPCDELRLGGVREGKSLLVYHGRLGPAAHVCPLAAETAEVHESLRALSPVQIDSIYSDIVASLNVMERLHAGPEHQVTAFNDIPGRVRYLENLHRQGTVCLLRVTQEAMRDPEIRRWLLALEYPFPVFRPPLTDVQHEETPPRDEARAVQLTNPRWEHGDETIRQSRPAVARGGDWVVLRVDVQGAADATHLTFDIYQIMGEGSAPRIDSVRGSIDNGVGSANWAAGKYEDTGDAVARLEFEGNLRGALSPRGPLEVEVVVEYGFSM